MQVTQITIITNYFHENVNLRTNNIRVKYYIRSISRVANFDISTPKLPPIFTNHTFLFIPECTSRSWLGQSMLERCTVNTCLNDLWRIYIKCLIYWKDLFNRTLQPTEWSQFICFASLQASDVTLKITGKQDHKYDIPLRLGISIERFPNPRESRWVLKIDGFSPSIC